MPHTSILRRLLLASAAMAAPLACAGAAFAADPSAPPKPAKSETQEIVVTATRQSQNLSKVPLSVSAFTAAKMDIQGVKSFADLAKFTPGVTFDEDRHDVSIRGIDSKAGSGTTGIYIDDTPIQVRALGLNANNTLPAVFDLQRVEVLRGPQGTLFGAGSEGGTVRYITTQPSLSTFSATAHTEVANTEDGAPSYELGVAMGGPIIKDVLGFRLSVWGRRDGGYIDRNNIEDTGGVEHDANRVDTYTIRLAATWAPTNNLTITPAINFEKRDQHNHDEYWVSTSNPNSGSFVSGTPDRMADPDHFYLPSVKVDWDLGPVKFISDTSYYNRQERVNGYSGTLYNLSYFQHFTNNTAPSPVSIPSNTPGLPANPIDPQLQPVTAPGAGACNPNLVTGPLLTASGLNLPGFAACDNGNPNYLARNWITNTQENFTQEFRLQSNRPGPLNWTAGLFYSHNAQRSTEEIYDPQLPQLTQYLWGEDMLTAWGEGLLANGDDYINSTKAQDRQIALFADGSYKITDDLKVTAGVRYAWTKFSYHNMNDGPQDLLDDGGVPATVQGGKSETPLTPKIGLSYQVTTDDMIYATVAKGYRIGGATPPLPVSACGGVFPTQYNSDTVMSYEVGSKDKFFDRKLFVSGSLFYIQWNNIQQAIYVPLCGIQYTSNVGNAISEGFDFQAQWQVTEAFDLEMSTGYTDGNYVGNAYDKTTGNELAANGDSLPVTPWTVTLAGQYDFSINDHDAFIRADYEFNSRRHTPIPAEDPQTAYYDGGLRPDPATNQVSARAGMTVNKWALAFFVENLFNAHPQLDLQHEDAGTALYEATTFRPRTIGVAATYKY